MRTITLLHGPPAAGAALLRNTGLVDRLVGAPQGTCSWAATLDAQARDGRSFFLIAETAPRNAFLTSWSQRVFYRVQHLVLAPESAPTAPIGSVHTLLPCDFACSRAELRRKVVEILSPPVIDMNRFRQIVFIGDIHGCDATLAALLDDAPARSDTGYVFLGDYISKGPATASVLRRLRAGYLGRDNVIAMAGNHESILETWAWEGQPRSRCFRATALPDLNAARYGPEEARDFLAMLVDARWISWRGFDILANHGGFSRVPREMGLLTSWQCRIGSGPSALDVDQSWDADAAGEAAACPGLVQVHGHRNVGRRPVAAGRGIFNLEGGVEAGGHLRALVLSDTGGRCRFTSVTMPSRDRLTPFIQARLAGQEAA